MSLYEPPAEPQSIPPASHLELVLFISTQRKHVRFNKSNLLHDTEVNHA